MAQVSYAHALQHLADAEPQRIAVTCDDESLTRGELARRSNRLARALQERGVTPGRLVTLGLRNGLEFVVACVAIWKCGAVPNPISPRLPALERAGILELANPALVIGFDDQEHAFPALPAGFEPPPALSDAPLPDVTSPHERAIASGGSTGKPKLIVAANAALHDPDRPGTLLSPKGCVLVPGPLYHAAPFGSMTQCLLAGEHLVLMSRFAAAACLELVEHHRVDQILFVPTMLHRIWRLPVAERTRYDVSSLRTVFTGSAPCPAWLMRAWIEWLGADVINELYGGTERIGGTFISGREWLEHPGSVGRPIGSAQIRIVDPDSGEDVAPGEVGEIYMLPVSGRGSTYRYVGAEPRSLAGGWESVGDMGRRDTDGYLFLADRRGDMILCGGRNVYPAQVEAALDSHPAVVGSVVIGLPDEDLGQRVHAIVQIVGEVGEAELREHLRDRIVHYCIPRSFEFVTEPVRDEAGKVRRWELRAQRGGTRENPVS